MAVLQISIAQRHSFVASKPKKAGGNGGDRGSIDFLCEVTVVCVWMAVCVCVYLCGPLTLTARFGICVCVGEGGFY